MLSIKQIDNIDELELYREEWDRTLQESSSNTIFLTFDWVVTWCKTYSEEGKVFILLITDDEELIGIAPLTIISSRIFGLPIKRLKFVGYNYLYYKDFIISRKREECLNLILFYLRDNSQLWDGIELSNIPHGSLKFNLFQNTCLTLGYFYYIKKGLPCPYVTLNNDWNDYWESRGKATRKNTINQIKRLKKSGVFHYKICVDINTFNKAVNIFFAQHIKRRIARWQISEYRRVKRRNFIIRIGKIFLKTKYLQFSFLELNDKILATCYGFKYNGKVYYYSPSFNLEYAKYSPGKVLLYYIIKNSFNENICEIDLLSGEDYYKFHWATNVRDNYQIQIFQKKPLSQALYYWLVKIKPRLVRIKFLRNTKRILYNNLMILMNKE